MRPPNGGKRGRSRGRNKGGHHHHGGHHNNINRTLESNGPDVKIRGTAIHIHEKYLALARDAHSSGDRIAAENYLQHAEHYHRLLASMAPPGQPYQPGGQQQGMNGTHAEGDEEGAQGGQGGNFQGGHQGAEAGQGFAGQPAGGNPGYQGRDRTEFREGGGERRDYRAEPREGNDMRREGEARRDFREERPVREERPARDERPREDRQLREERPPREERAPREDRPPREAREPREERQPREPRAQRGDAPQPAPRTDGEEALAFERRLNGRSRRVSAEDRNGRAITSLEREEQARAKPADPPETAADGDDADEALA